MTTKITPDKEDKPDKDDKDDKPDKDAAKSKEDGNRLSTGKGDDGMAISNPLAVRFCNERSRPLADSMLSTYLTAKSFVAEWDAAAINPLFPDDPAEVVADGAANDGRYPMTGAKARALYAAAAAIIAWFETGTPTRADRLRTMAVNGAGRF